jgi:outer membrane protein assembly factor BamB
MNHRLRRLGLAPMLALLIGLIALGSVAARQTSPPAPVWTYEFTDGAAYGLGLSEDGGTLIAVVGFGFDTGGTIISLDPATGEEIWAFSTEEGASADPIVVDGVVYAGMGSLVGGGAAVYALDATAGAELWRADIMNHELPATPVDAVVFADGKLFVNRADATLLKLDAASGQIEWSLDIQKPSRGAPAVAGDTVYVSTGFDGARILAIDNQDGTVRWSVEDPVNPVTGPVLANGFLYVPFVDGELAALDPATGDELRWGPG